MVGGGGARVFRRGSCREYHRWCGGGGGSYNIGANKQNLAGVNKGDGKVFITLEN